jgi:hypothetical protein
VQGKEDGHHADHEGQVDECPANSVVTGERRSQPQDARGEVYRPDRADARLDVGAYLRPGPRLDGLERRLGPGRPRGDVSGDRGELGVGPRGERLAQPPIQLVLVQPTLRERVLERLDRLLAVRVRCPQAAPNVSGCLLISRPCYHGALPDQA